MRTTLAVLLFCLLTTSTWGQNSEVEKLISEGISLHDKRLYPAAIERYKQALKLDPNSSTAYYEMAYSYALMGKSKKAIKSANKVIKIGRGNEGQAYMLKANLLDDMGKTAQAIKTYEAGLANDPNDYLMHFNYGISLVRDQQLGLAELALLNGAQLNPSHPSGHYVLGLVMADQGQTAQAVMSLYYFLMMEPEGDRADNAHQLLIAETKGNATKGEDGSINITLGSLMNQGTFSSTNMLLDLVGAVGGDIDKKIEEVGIEDDLTETERNLNRFKSIFKTISEVEAKNPTEAEQIWLDFYVAFYKRLLSEEMHLETASYLVQGPGGEKEVEEWLLAHQKELNRLKVYLNK